MANKKDLSKQLKVLVNYIKENSSNDSWTILTYRDIARIVGTTPGSSITKRLMEELKENEHIIYTLHLDPKKSKKPLKFRYVTEKEKYDFIDNKKYNQLTQEEVNSIKNIVGYTSHHELYDLLSVINYFKGISKDGRFKMPNSELISDILVIFQEDVEFILEFLKTKRLLVDENGYFRLCLNNIAGDTVVTQKSSNEKYSSVDDYLEEMQSIQKKLTEYLHREILPKVERIQHLEKQLSEGHRVTQRLISENEMIKNENESLKTKNLKLEQQLEHALGKKDELLVAIQEQLQIFLWQVDQVALADSQKSIHEKNKNSYRAALAKKYSEVGQEFYNFVLEFANN